MGADWEPGARDHKFSGHHLCGGQIDEWEREAKSGAITKCETEQDVAVCLALGNFHCLQFRWFAFRQLATGCYWHGHLLEKNVHLATTHSQVCKDKLRPNFSTWTKIHSTPPLNPS